MHNDDYKSLRISLDMAYERASLGKGKERHANNKPFEEQPICTELKHFGIKPALYQIRKKALECNKLGPDQCVDELLDIIVYAAAAVYHLCNPPTIGGLSTFKLTKESVK